MDFRRILKRYALKKILLVGADSLVLIAVIIVALSIHFSGTELYYASAVHNVPKLFQYLIAGISALVAFRYLNLYKQRIFYNRVEQAIAILKGLLFASLFLIVTEFFFTSPSLRINSRLHLASFITFGSILLITYRSIISMLLENRSDVNKLFLRRVVAIGAGNVGKSFAEEVAANSTYYLKVVGFIDDDLSLKGTLVSGIPVLGTLEEIEDIVDDYNIDEVFVTIESVDQERLLDILEIAKQTNRQVNLISSHFGVIERKVDVVEFKDLKCVPVFTKISPLYVRFFKRLFDLVVGSMIIAMISPILGVIALAVKLSSSGPVFYRSAVIGKNGEEFFWFKFRSMAANNNQKLHQEHLKEIITKNKTTEKIQNDPRVTKVGRIIRKFSLDELPQLFNVIRGEMSLIGPRPCLPYEYALMEKWMRRRTKVVPGMTGLWQIVGRNRKDVSFTDSIILDLYYADNLSFWLDMKILFKTVPVVIFGRGGS